MVNGIEPLAFGSEMGVHTATAKAEESKASFKSLFEEAIQNVESTDSQFQYDTQELLSGDLDNLADMTINANKAQVALSLVVTMRDKALEAYKEIMNMQL